MIGADMDSREQMARIDRELAATHALIAHARLSDTNRTNRLGWRDPAIIAALIIAIGAVGVAVLA